jgi:DNA helicase-2/ATP-dependent DNA helicase PcrA
MAAPKLTPAFAEAYKRLNTAQREAVDAIEGPVMVIAGPGTGKTQVLTLRIANILLKTDTPPDAILALTFTEAGVYAMKTRLASLIGPTAYSVKIHTFHSFCNSLIQDHPSYFKRLVGAEAITPIDSIIAARAVIDSRTWEHLTSFADTYVHVKDIISSIATLKREYISPEELLRRVEQETHDIKTGTDNYHIKGAYKGELKSEYKKKLDKLARTRELADAYARYEALLREQRMYDFEDMIVEVLTVFKQNKDFLQMIQEEYLYILADEHQDANTSQNTLLTMLASFHESPNLFLVGDEKQAIYSFQGASLEHFHAFKNTYPHAKMITLVDSYRSGTKILDASQQLMVPAVEPARNPRLISNHPEPHHATVTTHEFSTEEHELAWVAKDIHAKIETGVAPQEIAVLFRNNSDAESLSRALVAAEVPHLVETKQNALEHHRIQQLLTWMRASADVYADRFVAESLFAPWSGVEESDIHRIVRAVRLARGSFFDVLVDHARIDGIRDHEAVQRFVDSLTRGMKIAREDHARDFFSYCVRDSGFLRFVLTHQGTADVLARVRGMLATLERHAQKKVGYSAKAFLDDMDLYDRYGVPIDKDMPTPTTLRSVHVMTAHASKGLEFSYVYIIHARDKKWGNSRGRTGFYIPGLEKEGDDDERRLMYVALTRAKDAAYISHGKVTEDGREALPSLFLSDLGDHAQPQSTETFESQYGLHSILERSHGVPVAEDIAFLRALFVEQGLSVTALNNYLDLLRGGGVRTQFFLHFKNPLDHFLIGQSVKRPRKTVHTSCEGQIGI